MVLLMTTGQCRVHYQTNRCNFCNFWATRVRLSDVFWHTQCCPVFFSSATDRFDVVCGVILGVDLGADGASSRPAVGRASAGARRGRRRRLVVLGRCGRRLVSRRGRCGRRRRRCAGRRRSLLVLLLLRLYITQRTKASHTAEHNRPHNVHPVVAAWQLQPKMVQTVQQHVSYEFICVRRTCDCI